MGMEIPLETRFRAEELYIVDGLTFDQTSAATGVSVSQLQRWGAESDWPGRRREHRASLQSIRRDMVVLRKSMIEKAMGSLDPQDVYAVSRLEAAASKATLQAETPASQDSRAWPAPTDGGEPVIINTPADAVNALSTVVEKKLNALLTGAAVVDLKTVKQLRDVIDLVEKMRAKYAPEKDAAQKNAVDAETLKVIREKINLM